ncbi:ribonuclease D [uncultured Aliivibrio sp.]|uniref:ribonuclease D n=1 Tax=uncultured Aliivibrio sp. TaxID=873085 RepID=UPI002607B17F|nr:ribonuclease D [uncultured Aliivibrio sp.]
MEFEIVTCSQRLAEICQQASNKPFLMLDTEFVRTRTLYARLGLIQMFDGETLALVDPVEIDDLTPLWNVLKDESVTKVLHACGEDLEVFQHYAGCMPTPMIDTQIMAAFLGYGLSTGFAKLVSDYLGVDLDKGESRTDWMARPLSDKQLNYAAADVHYLLPLFEKLQAELAQTKWAEAAYQESALAIKKREKQPDAEKAYQDIKNAWQLNPKQLAILKMAAKWRLEEARKRDLAVNFVVQELNLWKLARFGLRSKEQMLKEDFDPREVQRHGGKLLRFTYLADDLAADEYPEVITRLMDYPAYKQIFKLLKDEVKEASDESGLMPEFLASKKQLNQLLSWKWKKNGAPECKPDAIQGWRSELLEARFMSVLDK